MSLYKTWNDDLEGIKTQEDYNLFWKNYLEKETDIYKKILAENIKVLSGTVKELSEKFSAKPTQIVGFLDGASASFTTEFEKEILEALTEESEINLEFDYEKLLWNMHDAKADWLFGLSEWDNILPVDKRLEIRKEYNRSKQVVKEDKIGRNDPCTCGSGKKYKKCCGK